jgi:hypothetical protein
MKTALWLVSLTASQAGEDSQTKRFKDTIKSSTLTDLIEKQLRKNETARNIFRTAESA